MRRIAAAFALALTVAAQAAAAVPTQEPVLAISWKFDEGTLMSVDPVSLDPASERVVPLGTWPQFLAWSPDRRHVAVLAQTGYPPRVLIVNTDRMAVERTIRTGSVLGAAWLRPHRLLLVEEPGLLGIVDPLGRRGIRWKFFRGSVLRWAHMRDALIVLGGPSPSTVGTALLSIISPEGVVRSMKLPGIAAGSDYRQERIDVPALAVDPSGERAVVIAGCLCAAVEVDLRTRAVHLHELANRRLAMSGSGPSLTAVWLEGDRVAVAGRHLEEHESSPLGLALLDLRDWSLQRLDPQIQDVVRAEERLLALGAGRLTVYTADGTPRFGFPWSWSVSAAGAYLYVQREGATDVLDSTTGRVVASTPVRLTVLGDL